MLIVPPEGSIELFGGKNATINNLTSLHIIQQTEEGGVMELKMSDKKSKFTIVVRHIIARVFCSHFLPTPASAGLLSC